MSAQPVPKSSTEPVLSTNVESFRDGLLPESLDCRHVEAVTLLAAECFPSPWGPKDFAYFLSHDNRICLGLFGPADVSGEPKLMAYFLGLLVQGDLDIVSVATHPEARRRGLGGRLLEEAFRQPGVERIFLEVASSNEAAVGLYRKLGFLNIGVRRGYYGGKEDAYLMTRGAR